MTRRRSRKKTRWVRSFDIEIDIDSEHGFEEWMVGYSNVKLRP